MNILLDLNFTLAILQSDFDKAPKILKHAKEANLLEKGVKASD
jgi:hypothetical protein